MIVPLAKGLLTFAFPNLTLRRGAFHTESARYCYGVFLRHLVLLHEAGAAPRLGAVAELGPGNSLGTGLAALVAGAERYYGLDAVAHHRPQRLAPVFEELVALFAARAPIPGPEEFPDLKPALADHRFPAHILGQAALGRALAPDRLARLRADLARPDGAVRYAAPWTRAACVPPASLDWVFSQAVMEHVADIGEIYRHCRGWLGPGGVMSHQIDFKCHGTAAAWNGHWAYSDFVWRLMVGGRPYHINRAPLSAHVAAMEAEGFHVLGRRRHPGAGGIARARLAARFQSLSDADLETAGAFVVARRAA